MADIRCPACGKENPSSLRVCQFCQAPLPSDNTLRIGDKPTKKNTGELEPVLPDWLRDVRQQARDSAEKDASDAAAMPKIQKAEPPDLLAGLASQSSGADDEDVPDWLASLRPKSTEKPAAPPAPAKPEVDFFAQFDESAFGGSPKEPETPDASTAGSSLEQPSEAPQHDELSEWFTKASEQPDEPFALDSTSQPMDLGWDIHEGTFSAPSQDAAPPSQGQEDLSWLRDLEAESKKTGELPSSQPAEEWPSALGLPASAPSSSQEDLSWLNDLGALPAAEVPPQESPKPGEDLSWLRAFGETSQPAQPVPPPSSSQDDLSWLNDLGALPAAEAPSQEPSQPAEDLSWLQVFGNSSTPTQNVPPQDDLSWLNDLGKAGGPAPSPDATASDDLGWLHDLQGTPGSLLSSLPESQSQPPKTVEPPVSPDSKQLSPRQTAPLSEGAGPFIPDWLKEATEQPSLPLGPQALDQIRKDKGVSVTPNDLASAALFGAAMHEAEEPAPPAQPGDSSSLFSQDVNSIFSQKMPDWLASSGSETGQPAEEEIGIHAEGGEALSPAELPSWVQAMRPVEAVIAENVPGVEDQPAERQGPLAGLRGVLPIVAIGALRKPQPIPLKLQVSGEQQASAGILEELLAGETIPRSLAAVPAAASQRRLRWLIAGLLLFILGAVLFSGTQMMPVSPSLPPAARDLTNAVMSIPENAPVLVILDYEPALAGEMEAVSGPMLDQLVQLRDPYLSFLATSPNGNALVGRLLANTKISPPGGAPYIEGQNYTNLGYLPGGESGVLGFIQSPQGTMPASRVLEFSEYAAILLLTDHAESARSWVEQLSAWKQSDPTFASQPVLVASSAQAGPMLQPYFDSGQINGMVSGLPIAARYEAMNFNRPGTARIYWDAFGAGMMMAVMLIVLGSLWSVYAGYRARRMEAAKE